MKRLGSIGWVPVWLGIGVAVATAAGIGRAEKGEGLPLFQGDARLEKRVTLQRGGVPVEGVLLALSKETGVPLSAARSTADDKVSLFVKDRPLGETLTRLGQHFGFQWRKEGDRYVLEQSAESARQEAARRLEQDEAQRAALQEQMARLAALAVLSPEQQEARLVQDAARLQAPDLDPAARKELMAEGAALRSLQQPGGAAAMAYYRSLDAARVRALLSGAELRASTQNNTLLPSVASLIHAMGEEIQKSVPDRGLAIGGEMGPAGREDRPPRADVLVRLSASDLSAFGPPGGVPGTRPGRRRLRLEFTLTSARSGGPGLLLLPVTWSVSAPEADPDAPTAAELSDPELRQPVSLELKAAPVSGKQRFLLGAPLPQGQVPLAEVARALHEATGLDVLADSFVRTRVDPRRLTGKRPLGEVLSTLSRELDYTCRKEGDLLTLRSRVYYQDRAAEVPDRLLQSWRKRPLRAGLAGLTEVANVVAALSDPQVESLEVFWAWYLEGADAASTPMPQLYANREHLRFWAGLQAVQRQTAGAGKLVPSQSLSVAQRRLFVAALQSPQEGPLGLLPEAAAVGAPTAAQLAGAAFSLRPLNFPEPGMAGPGMVGPARFGTGGPGGRPGGPRQLGAPQPGGPGMPAPEGGVAVSGVFRRFDGPEPPELPAGGPQIGGPGAPGGPGGPEMGGPGGAAVSIAMDGFRFTYYLAGSASPARMAHVHLPISPDAVQVAAPGGFNPMNPNEEKKR